MFRFQGDNSKAESYYKKSLEIYEKTYGKDHPLIAIILDKMREFYEGTGRNDEAKILAERVKMIYSNYQK